MWTTRGHYFSREGPSGYIEGILHFHDFNQGSESQKMMISKRHTDGLEAPRNSLELTTETSKSYHMVHENIPFSLQVKQHPIKRHFQHPGGVTMKKLIDKEMSSNTTRHSAPSVVARLMGMDALPSEGNQLIHSNEHGSENSRNYLPRKNNINETSSHYKQLRVMSLKQKKQELPAYDIKKDSIGCSKTPRMTKPHRREHPQEELLQKFKKDFEAWQAAKVWERSRAVGLDDHYLKERNNQNPALENLEKQKKALYANTERNPSHRKSAEYLTTSTAILGKKLQRSSLEREGYMSKGDLHHLMETSNSRNRSKFNDSVQYPELKFSERQDRSSSPTRIVILKPSTESSEDIVEAWPCSSGVLEREGSIEHFLEEVRDRLRLEIQGKTRNEMRTSKCSGEIPFSEKLTDPKRIAQHIAKQIRENVTRDLGTTLMRSESTRSYRSESQPIGPDSPEFINRNTRKILCERLRNVLRNEADVGITVSNGKLRPPSIVKERTTLRQFSDSPNLRKSYHSEDIKGATEMTTMSFREEQLDNLGCGAGDLSPRNLVRSLSAPVSGTAFGKLLLDDQNVLEGIHIRRKHESTENTSVEARKIQKDVFSIKGRVSNLRHNLILRGKLFGRKMESADESSEKRNDFTQVISSSPSVVPNLGIAQENSTEVPPSPASVSSNSFDELCKPSHPSPVSPLEMPFTEEHLSLENSREISSVLPEVQEQSELITNAAFQEIPEVQEVYDAVDMKCLDEAYLREILITAGLYDKPLHKLFMHCDAVTKPIADSVFGGVEEAYAKCDKENDMCHSQTVACRKVLFDLLNEELLRVLSVPISSSVLKRYLGCTQVLQGKKLLEDVWRQVEIHLHPPLDESSSLDSLVAYDLRATTWSSMLQEDIDVVGADLEYMILLGLVDELVSDVCC